MKKAVLILAALLLVSSFVFAQDAGVKIGAWGRGIFVPAMGGITSDVQTKDQVSWGGVPRVGMTISGTSANVGFQADFNVDKGGPGLGDQQKIWVKPLDMLTLQIGTVFDDTLRGGIGFGAWNWVRFSTMSGDDAVFGRLGSNGGQENFALGLAPIEGLYILAGVNGILGTAVKTQDVLQLGQYGAGYTIAGIGTIRAQYIGAGTPGNLYGVINAAFKLTAVDKLTIDVGTYIPTDATLYNNTTAKVAGIVTYGGVENLTINAATNVAIPKSGDTAMEFAAGVDYNLGDGLAVTVDGNYSNAAAATGFANGAISGIAAIQKGFSNGLIGIGVEVTTGNFAGAAAKSDTNAPAWMIPVRFEYWF